MVSRPSIDTVLHWADHVLDPTDKGDVWVRDSLDRAMAAALAWSLTREAVDAGRELTADQALAIAGGEIGRRRIRWEGLKEA